MSFPNYLTRRNGSNLSTLERTTTNDSDVITKRLVPIEPHNNPNSNIPLPQFTPQQRRSSTVGSTSNFSDSDPEADLNALQANASSSSRESDYLVIDDTQGRDEDNDDDDDDVDDEDDDDDDDDSVEAFDDQYLSRNVNQPTISYSSSSNYDNFNYPPVRPTDSTSMDFLPTRSNNQTTQTSSFNLNITPTQSMAYDVEGEEEEENYNDGYAKEPRIIDKIASTTQMVDYQDKLYESLNILQDVESIRNLKFFEENYTKNLNLLKKSQLELLLDLGKVNEHSFEEFYKAWNTFDNNRPKETVNGREPEFSNRNSSTFSKLHQTGTTTPMSNGIDSGLTLDINSSKFFDDMVKRNDLIVEDLNKIKDDIATIDKHTRTIWDQI
ncbi:hypothetical protein CANARDRAFT_26629 [[Candida] arabinofermentans NRRL YB-2248]|uniref:Uncharacterized protein n=1 Tax=[Candida] arabinofermentans NRRL YB-2248 TaxID=983967 RepID=A0A1E4T617_9ASCO|nr:hypothetical protein CANARDRAFT_26629 [[Candida] arabinofermentans NRRL YB-2248]